MVASGPLHVGARFPSCGHAWARIRPRDGPLGAPALARSILAMSPLGLVSPRADALIPPRIRARPPNPGPALRWARRRRERPFAPATGTWRHRTQAPPEIGFVRCHGT
eukprot:4956919-Pyramimonas_sp.AAC.2